MTLPAAIAALRRYGRCECRSRTHWPWRRDQ